MKAIALLFIAVLLATSVFAEMTISVKSDLSEIIVQTPIVDTAKTYSIHGDKYSWITGYKPSDKLTMAHGVAWYIKSDTTSLVFMTAEAINHSDFGGRGIMIAPPAITNPGNLKKGLWLIMMTSAEVIIMPVQFNPAKIGQSDDSGGFWHTGDIFLDPKKLKLVKDQPIIK